MSLERGLYPCLAVITGLYADSLGEIVMVTKPFWEFFGSGLVLLMKVGLLQSHLACSAIQFAYAYTHAAENVPISPEDLSEYFQIIMYILTVQANRQ